MTVKKIAFLALHLGYGGAERAVISEANLLSEFCEVEIISFYKLYEKPAFDINPNVRVTYLTENLAPNRDEIRLAIKSRNPFAVLREGLKAVKILFLRKSLMKKAVKRSDADIIISSRYIYHKLLTDNAKKNTVCIAQEHNHHNGDEKYIQKQVDAVKQMDYFMPVSMELCDFYSKRVNGKVKCKYIPHHLEYIPENLSPLTEKNIISVGRLEPVKGMDELIPVFAEIHKSCPEWKLSIVGDGSQREKIESLISEYGLENSVILHGYKTPDEINGLLYESSVYVMSSHSESFGLVLIEAQSFGLPCVAFDSAKGAVEILKPENSGILIENRSVKDMAEAVCGLINDFEYRRETGLKGRKNAEKYSFDNVKKQWQEFIETL